MEYFQISHDCRQGLVPSNCRRNGPHLCACELPKCSPWSYSFSFSVNLKLKRARPPATIRAAQLTHSVQRWQGQRKNRPGRRLISLSRSDPCPPTCSITPKICLSLPWWTVSPDRKAFAQSKLFFEASPTPASCRKRSKAHSISRLGFLSPRSTIPIINLASNSRIESTCPLSIGRLLDVSTLSHAASNVEPKRLVVSASKALFASSESERHDHSP